MESRQLRVDDRMAKTKMQKSDRIHPISAPGWASGLRELARSPMVSKKLGFGLELASCEAWCNNRSRKFKTKILEIVVSIGRWTLLCLLLFRVLPDHRFAIVGLRKIDADFTPNLTGRITILANSACQAYFSFF